MGSRPFLPHGSPEQYARHRKYVAALKAAGVKIILGNFKKKTEKV